jgi:large subunit ribosomal protein L21
MHAVIETGGNQYRIETGDTIDVEKLTDVEAGDTVEFDVLSVGEGEDISVGRPLLEDATVSGEVIEHGRGDKKIVFKKKRRKKYRRKHGHRQPYTRVRIDEIEGA